MPIGSLVQPAAVRDEVPGGATSCCPTGVNADSQDPLRPHAAERVEKVAPWLTLDGDPYPAVVDGRIEWIVDGYTTTQRLPVLARARTLGDVDGRLADRRNRSVGDAAVSDQVNYIRNSVKATVDAYNGTVTLYAVGRPRTRSSRPG